VKGEKATRKKSRSKSLEKRQPVHKDKKMESNMKRVEKNNPQGEGGGAGFAGTKAIRREKFVTGPKGNSRWGRKSG